MNPILVPLFFATLATGLVLGTRLLLLYRRTRGIPELVIGVAAIATCLAGVLRGWLVNFGADATPFAEALGQWLFSLLVVLGPIGMVLGTWRVFRPDEGWARWLALGLVAVLAVSLPLLLLPESLQQARRIVIVLAGVAVSAWNAAEALAHYGKLRRRMRLGLCDAVTASQFLFWGVAMVANTGSRLITLGAVSLTTLEPLKNDGFVGPVAVCGFATLAFLYLAFFPPLAMQDWISTRAARAGA